MRPVRLELEGFGTFRDRTAVDFDGIELAAFVGATGSGKSTVIDAITFALYGSVARYDNPSLVAPVIHQLATEAKVRLDFELGGRSYTAVRVVRRVKSKPGTALKARTREARLEVADSEGDQTTVLAGGPAELDDAVVELLGLDFGQFTRTIVLPQGDFAQFLTDEPSDRQKLLRRLLDLDLFAQMGGLARERAARANQQADALQTELDRLDGVTADAVAAAEGWLVGLDTFAAAIGDQLANLATIEADLVDRREKVVALDGSLDALSAVAVPGDLTAADAAVAAARTARDEGQAALDAKRIERDDAAAALDAVGDLDLLRRKVDRRGREIELVASIEALTAEVIHAQTERDALADQLIANTATAEETVAAVRAMRTGVDAAAWVVRLEVGEPCPICSETVRAIPDHITSDELAAAEQRSDAAQNALSAATADAARADGRLQSLEADLAHQQKVGDELAAELEGIATLDELTAEIERATAAAQRVQAIGGEMRAAESAAGDATKRVNEAERAIERFGATFTDQRDRVAALGPPSPGDPSLAANWDALAAWATDQASRLQAEREELATDGKQLAAAKAEAVESLRSGAEPLGLEPDPATIVASAAAARATASADVDRLRADLAHKDELYQKVLALREEHLVHDALGRQHLSVNGFERWLLAEAVDDIVDRATDGLFELSDGRYSLEADNGAFSVRDHGNADERRDVKTLSGGEIFLASLALALALADSIAELAPVDSPRLESIFLDEGFGTLDDATLDVVASAIEELSATGRMVVVVTHVRDLAERMPVRFEVRKGPTTSAIERVEG